jgi:hypothetical protein
MRPIRLEPIKREEVYGNWKMLSPEGTLMCRLSDKKAHWYLERNLAVVEDDEPKTIRLTFVPNGIGDTNEYMLEDKASMCVVCGTKHDLTFHHVVPHGYRKHFPIEWKSHSSHDNLLLCERCHHLYERAAWELKKRLQIAYAPITPSDKEARIARNKAVRAAFALVRDIVPTRQKTPRKTQKWRHETGQRALGVNAGRAIPEEKMLELRELVAPYLPDLENETIIAFVKDAKKNPDRQDPVVDCEAVSRAVVALGEDEMRRFIERWRRHFIETAQPQYLSDSWSIDWHKDVETA